MKGSQTGRTMHVNKEKEESTAKKKVEGDGRRASRLTPGVFYGHIPS